MPEYLRIIRILLYRSLMGICMIALWSCQDETNGEIEEELQEKICEIDIDTLDFTFGMDYMHPEKYLLPGAQSDLSDTHLSEVIDELGRPDTTLDGLLSICRWVNRNFTFENKGGSMIGVPTVDELLNSRLFYGCHSQALIISSVARRMGFPAIMVETASVQWAYRYKEGIEGPFYGHVMSEIFVDGRWILLDNNGQYVSDYDGTNPFIPTDNPYHKDLFVLAKGLDTWDYFSKSDSDTHTLMTDFAENVYCFEEFYDSIYYRWVI